MNDEITYTFNQAKAANSAFPSSLYSTKYLAVTAADCKVKAQQAATETVIALTSASAANCENKIPVGSVVSFASQTTQHYVTAVGTRSGTDITITITPGLSETTALDAGVNWAPHAGFTLNLLSATSTSAKYRVAATPATGTSTIGVLVPTPEIAVTPAGLTAADAKVTFSAKTAGGTAMDALATSATVATSRSMFTSTIGKFNGIIDVEQGRKAFKGGNSTSSSDTLSFNTTTNAIVAGNGVDNTAAGVPNAVNAVTPTAATMVSTIHTVDGDWNWMDTSATTAGVQTTGISGTVTPALNTAGTKVTITDLLANESAATLVVAKTATTAATLIPVSSFSGSSKYNYTSSTVAKTKTTTHASLGAFALNGAVVTAYGVPMGSTVSRFLWVNNKGAIAAPMSAVVTAAGTAYGPYSVGSAAAKSSMSMSSALDAALTAAGVSLAQNSRANIEFTSPVKAGDVTISAAYKHIADADRLTLETSDTVVGAINCTGTDSARGFVSAETAADDLQNNDTIAAGTTTDACTNAK